MFKNTFFAHAYIIKKLVVSYQLHDMPAPVNHMQLLLIITRLLLEGLPDY